MPATTNSMFSKSATGKRFELPALDFKFGSLTEGTDIPPPPPSPPPKEAAPKEAAPRAAAPPPKTRKEEPQKAKVAVPNGKPNVSHDPLLPVSVQTRTLRGTKRPAPDSPASPTSTRQGSIRRLFSRNTLNTLYQNGEHARVSSEIQRPASRLSTMSNDVKKNKRSSGWFSRLRSSDNVPTKMSAPMSPTIQEEPKKPAGPPPPMIPELTKVNQEHGGLGEDLFKDIK